VWDSSWACPQGLYQMLRDCVGHMLRHLPKAVRPDLIRDGLWEVDLRIQISFVRICGIRPEELSVGSKTRIELPIRLQGMGLTPICEIAEAIYVGTVQGVAPKLGSSLDNLTVTDVAGLEEAVARLKLTLDVPGERSKVPEALDILDKSETVERTLHELEENETVALEASDSVGTGRLRPKVPKKLAWRLADAIYTKRRGLLPGSVRGLEHFALLNVTCETAGDFLKASIAFSRNRFGLHFRTAVRMYLGLPVTASVLYSGANSSRAIVPNGEGASRAANTRRHTGLKNDVNSMVAFLGRTLGMEVIYEARMRDYFQLRPTGVEGPAGSYCDALLTTREGRRVAVDYVIHHPVMANEDHWNATGAVKGAVESKHNIYCKWEIVKEDVIPLAFSSYGAYAEESFDFLKRLSFSLAGKNTRKAALILWRIRERIAVAIVTGQARAVAEINRNNFKAPSGPWGR
jgi:hypothetical protein